ncbi:MAG: acetylglutamate kinase [Saprospiraceae bacterium]
MLTILKIGGNVIENDAELRAVLQGFTQIEGHKILVHGGGRRATEMLPQLGIEPKMINGRRITDAATLEVVTMVYAGLINKKIVSLLQSFSNQAIGLSGADLNTIQSHKRIVRDIDYGFAGDIDYVNTEAIRGLLEMNATPVFCAITHDKQGQLLNTNADTIAATLAGSLAEFYDTTLMYCFEKNGVLSEPENDDSVIRVINEMTYQSYKQSGIISAGMIPKMDNAFFALSKGVKEVQICGTAKVKGEKGVPFSTIRHN